MRPPKFSVEGWGADGPLYTEHRLLTRSERRAGEAATQQRGEAADGDEHADPDGYLAWAHGDTEVWLFNRGHAYDLTVLIDGDEHHLLVDAREGYATHVFRDGVQLLERAVADVETTAPPAPEEAPAELAPEPAGDPVELSDEELEALTAPAEVTAPDATQEDSIGDDEDAVSDGGKSEADEEE